MNRWWPLILLSAALTAEQPLLIESGIQLFDDWVTSQVERNQIPGAAIAIVHKDKVLWKKAYGNASLKPKEPATTATLFPLGGLTKPFTAMAVLKLWQEGKIDLDTPIGRYAPDFTIKKYRPTKQPITIRQLLQHTSGMPEDAQFAYWNDLQFPKFASIWDRIKDQSLIYPPGTTWKYSHLGYAVLGRLIELASNQEYVDYLQKNILEPLAMTSTAFSVQARAQGFTEAYRGRRIIPSYETNGMRAALGLYSNVEDMSKFASYFLLPDDPVKVLQSPTRRLMSHSSITIAPNLGYGLGFSLRKGLHDAVYIEHPGTMPGSACYLSISPKDMCAVIIMCNCEQFLSPWVDEAARWVFSSVYEVEKNGDRAKPIPSDWQKYRGRYKNRDHEVFVEAYDGKLVLYEPLFENKLDTLEYQPDGRFRIKEGYTFGSTNGDAVTFHVAEDGKVDYMKIANIYLFKAF
ncbi:MAG: beta-lactamase family protein [Verrucomicrobia bacterium]|nr:beta-lactamase family protein [Verrucomicrobiota bacterium]